MNYDVNMNTSPMSSLDHASEVGSNHMLQGPPIEVVGVALIIE